MSRQLDNREPRPPDDGDVVGYDGASRHCGIKVPTLYSMVARKQIPHIRVSGRLVLFRKSELDEWLGNRTVKATGNP